MEFTRKRETWIDCAKYCAIIAVAVDHCNGWLYTSPYIAYGSYFSVTLFVLLSGLGAWKSYLRKPQSVRYQLKKIGGLLAQYALATFILYCYYNRYFDLRAYITHLLNFSISGPFYFFVFFFQLLLVSPYLLHWCMWCNGRETPWLWHGVTLIALCAVSSVCINHTMMLPVHGGGKHLFGGTYLLVYYMGVLLGNGKLFNMGCANKHAIYIYIYAASVALWIPWVYMMANGRLPFDNIVAEYFGAGFNPPSINFIVFTLINLFLYFSFFNLMDGWKNRFIQRLVGLGALFGKNTLYIFMYHILVRDIIKALFPSVSASPVLVRAACLLAMVTLPVLAALLIKRVSLWFKEEMRMQKG